MTVFVLLFTLAAIGIAETTYLIRSRHAAEKPVCIIGSDCHVVLTSKYNKIFFIHNDVAGLIFYLVAAFLTALLFLEVGYADLITNLFAIMLVGASIMSLGLVFLQWRVIKAWCFWCLSSAGTVWLMTLILTLYFSIR